MEKYRKLKVIGKGSFGYAVLVQSIADRQTYVMKVSLKSANFSLRSSTSRAWTANNGRTP